MNKINKKLILVALVIVSLFSISQTARALTLTPIRLEIGGDPGQTVEQEMTLINEQATTQTFYSSYANFEAQGETGTPTFVAAKDGLGTWMSVPVSVTLTPGESKVIPIKIAIPLNADPGGHFATIFWGTTPVSTTPGAVAIGAKTGMLVLLRVTGPVNEQGGILEFATKDKQTYYTSLPVTFYYRFQNAGGDRIKPVGEVAFKNMFGITASKIDANPVEGNILPSSIRKFETTWQGQNGPTPKEDQDQGNFFTKAGYEWHNFAFGHYKAILNLKYGTQNEIATAAFSFWVFPWHLTVFLLVLLILLFFGGRTFIKHYNKWVIRKAEEMIKRERSQETHGGANSGGQM